MSLLTILWIFLAACALAAGQDVPQDPCAPAKHSDPPLTAAECLEHCNCVYCYPLGVGPGNGTDAEASALDDARAHEKEPVVGCTDWIHLDRCVGNYSTNYESDRCKHGRHVTQMTFIIFMSVVVGCCVLYGLYAFAVWARRECCSSYRRVPAPARAGDEKL